MSLKSLVPLVALRRCRTAISDFHWAAQLFACQQARDCSGFFVVVVFCCSFFICSLGVCVSAQAETEEEQDWHATRHKHAYFTHERQRSDGNVTSSAAQKAGVLRWHVARSHLAFRAAALLLNGVFLERLAFKRAKDAGKVESLKTQIRVWRERSISAGVGVRRLIRRRERLSPFIFILTLSGCH